MEKPGFTEVTGFLWTSQFGIRWRLRSLDDAGNVEVFGETVPKRQLFSLRKQEAVLIDFGLARQFVLGAIQRKIESRGDC